MPIEAIWSRRILCEMVSKAELKSRSNKVDKELVSSTQNNKKKCSFTSSGLLIILFSLIKISNNAEKLVPVV